MSLADHCFWRTSQVVRLKGIFMTADHILAEKCKASAWKARGSSSACSLWYHVGHRRHLSLCRAATRPHLKNCIQTWATLPKKRRLPRESSESSHKMVKEQRSKPHTGGLKGPTLCSVEGHRIKGSLIETFRIWCRLSRYTLMKCSGTLSRTESGYIILN